MLVCTPPLQREIGRGLDNSAVTTTAIRTTTTTTRPTTTEPNVCTVVFY